MRILLLSDRIPPENKGGAEAAAWNLARGLHRAGYDVHVAAATDGRPFEEVREGIPTYHLHSEYRVRFRAWLSLMNPQTVGPLRDLYKRLRPDVVNAHNIHRDLSYHSLTLAHRMGIGTVFNSHDVMPFTYGKLYHFVNPERCRVESPAEYKIPFGHNLARARFRYNPLRNPWIRQVLGRHTDVRVTPSMALKQAHEANGLPPFEVVAYGFDVERFTASQETISALRDRLDLHGRKVILFAGRLTGAKGTQQILDAMNELILLVPEALLLVLTARPIDAQLDQPDYRHLKGAHVRSGGWLTGEELVAAYHLADVVTVPSIVFDTFPVVNLEGMAAGKPLVSTCYGGSPEIIVDGETGYLVNPFETVDYAAKLAALLSDAGLRQRMGQAGRQRLIQSYPIDRQVREMMAVYMACEK